MIYDYEWLLAQVENAVQTFASANPNLKINLTFDDDCFYFSQISKMEARNQWVADKLCELEDDCDYEIISADYQCKVMEVRIRPSHPSYEYKNITVQFPADAYFSESLGLALAYAKFYEEEIPDFVFFHE